MNCAEARRQLARALAARDAHPCALAAHLASCGACREEARAAERVERALAGVVRPSLPTGLDRRLDEAIRGARPRVSWTPALAAVSVVVLVLLGGLALWPRERGAVAPMPVATAPPAESLSPPVTEPVRPDAPAPLLEPAAPAAPERAVASVVPALRSRTSARNSRPAARVAAPPREEPLRTERMSAAAVEALFASLPEVTVAMDVPAVLTDFEVGATGRLTAVASLAPREVALP